MSRPSIGPLLLARSEFRYSTIGLVEVPAIAAICLNALNKCGTGTAADLPERRSQLVDDVSLSAFTNFFANRRDERRTQRCDGRRSVDRARVRHSRGAAPL